MRGPTNTMVAVGLLVVCLGQPGCGQCEGPYGTWTDAKTKHGSFDGYELLSGCSDTPAIFVRGSGSKWYGDVAPGDPNRDQALMSLSSTLIEPVAPPGYLSSRTGFMGEGCKNTSAALVLISRWWDVDPLIKNVDAVLKREDLKEEVRIEITSLCGD